MTNKSVSAKGVRMRESIAFDDGPLEYLQINWAGGDVLQVAEAPKLAELTIDGEPKSEPQRRGIYRKGYRAMTGVLHFEWCGWDVPHDQ